MAAAALFGDNLGLAEAVHGHFTGAATAAHTDIFDGASEARHFMSLEVGQGNEDVGVHDGAADESALEFRAVFQRYFHVVGTLQTVADDDLAAGAQGGESVFIRGIEMLKSMLAAADVQGVAVGKEGASAEGLHPVDHGAGEVGAKEGEVPRFAEVHFDGHELVFEVDGFDAGGSHELVELVQQTGADLAAHVGKIDFRCGHRVPPDTGVAVSVGLCSVEKAGKVFLESRDGPGMTGHGGVRLLCQRVHE